MNTPRRLIVNADDLGYDPAVNRGILEAMRQGVVTSATLMVNTPYSNEAAGQAKGLALGLHLNLARWKPISAVIPPALLANGEFRETAAAALTIEMVKAETEAQLYELERLLHAKATHIDVHKHLHLQPNVLEGVARAAQGAGLPVRALNDGMRKVLHRWQVATTDHFIGEAGSQAFWTLEHWRAELAGLPPGITELMCHPGYAPTHVKSGYGKQREVELATFTAADAKEALKASGVECGDFRMLARAPATAAPRA